MTVLEFLGCPLACGRDLPHDCEAERSLVALIVTSELYAQRIVPKLQTTDFIDPALRGAFASLRERWAPYPSQLAATSVYASESDPRQLDRYIETVKARATQRLQIGRLAQLSEQVFRAPMAPRDFDWQVLNLAGEQPVTPPPPPLRRVSLVDLVVDPEEDAA